MKPPEKMIKKTKQDRVHTDEELGIEPYRVFEGKPVVAKDRQPGESIHIECTHYPPLPKGAKLHRFTNAAGHEVSALYDVHGKRLAVFPRGDERERVGVWRVILGG